MREKLESIHSSQKSFGGKAEVETNGNIVSLYSYDTFICSIRDGEIVDFSRTEWHYSATTMRHLNEFLQQNGNKSFTRKEWLTLADIA